MADIELVIKIDNQTYNNFVHNEYSMADVIAMHTALINATPLPKGHGRLKDVDWIDDNCPDYRTEDGAWCYKWEDIDNAETIIEADRAESEVRE